MNKNYSEKFEKMRVAGNLAAKTLDMITGYINPGISTNEIDKIDRFNQKKICSLCLIFNSNPGYRIL